MRELLIITDLYPRFDGDIRGIFIRSWARALSNHFNVTVLNINFYGPEAGTRYFAEPHHVVQHNLADHPTSGVTRKLDQVKYFSVGKALIKELDKQFDVVHAHGSVFAGGLALKNKGTAKVVITEHAGPVESFLSSSLRAKSAAKHFRSANGAVFVSTYSQRAFNDGGVHQAQSLVIGNPIDESTFHYSEGDRTKTLVFVGRLDPFKGGLRVARLFQELGLGQAGWKLIVVGNGDEGKAIDGLNDQQIQRHNFLPPEQLAELYRTSHAMLAPSLHESFGLVSVEAIACGCPVIGPKITGPADYMTPENGLWIDPSSDDELRDALTTMCVSDMPWDRAGMSRSMIEKYGLANFGERLTNFYSSLK